MNELRACPECGVAAGATHAPGCTIERCSVCGHPRYKCDEDECADHDRVFAKWTGFLPGEAEANLLDITIEKFTASNYFRRIFFTR